MTASPSRRLGPGLDLSVIESLLKGRRLTKPLIAAVEGPAIAGGTEILQATDIRVAGESAQVRRVRAALGAVPAGRLRRAPGPADPVHGRRGPAAHRPAHQGRRGPRIGLIGHVVPDGQALDKALEIADAIAANGPLAVQAILRTIRETEGLPENDAFRLDAKFGMAVFRSEDAREGPRAFAEKRKPEFKGK